jgi:hypothetical protein
VVGSFLGEGVELLFGFSVVVFVSAVIIGIHIFWVGEGE